MEIELPDFDPADVQTLIGMFQGLTVERRRMLVSEWAEQKRYLPSELTAKPGRWSNKYTPYLVDIMDALSPSHPARKLWVMKGAQIGATTGILENFLGYTVDHNPGGCIYVSADADLTKLGMELKISRMLEHSGLSDKIRAPHGNTKRSGDTATLKEFAGGFLLAVGARSVGKLRSNSVPFAVLDELDGMPGQLGNTGREEGGVIGLVEKRTDTYAARRKILGLSTPLVMQTSIIHPLYLQGDQRIYKIPCIHCGHMQALEWHGTTDDGKGFGFTFDLDDSGRLVEDSVGYVCRECSAIFYNHDKTWFLERGEWQPQAQAEEEGVYSWHLPSFLSPVGMYPWKATVYKWLKAWDVGASRVKDIDEFRQFYNLERGEPFEQRGESPKFERAQMHRRAVYHEGQIPNTVAIAETGAPVVFLTCAVDVHKDRLDVEVVGWCKGRQSYSVEWLHLKGAEGEPFYEDTDCPADQGAWRQLGNLIDVQNRWTADDDRTYAIAATMIDVGWAARADNVYAFCNEFSTGVYPVMGRELPAKGSAIKEFQESESKFGHRLFNVTASLYKDRLARWLRVEWAPDQLQPEGYPNYPLERSDAFFREYESEEKVEILQKVTKKRIGWAWRQKGQQPNHAWDCRVYAMAAFDLVVWDTCVRDLGLTQMSYPAFFDHATPVQVPEQGGAWTASPFSWHPNTVAD